MGEIISKNNYRATSILHIEKGAVLVRAVGQDGERVVMGLYDEESFPIAKASYATFKRKAVETLEQLAVVDKERMILFKDEEGESYLSKLSRQEIVDEDFWELFRLNKFAKFSNIALDMKPENFMRVKKRAVYLSYRYGELDKAEEFEKTGIFLYFHGEAGLKHLKEQGYLTIGLSKTAENVTNKAVVLCVVKNYQ